jgi:nucleotide-binding universal stress UspA family protein
MRFAFLAVEAHARRDTPMNLAFTTIIVATDFSPPSALALEYAHTLARRFQAGLIAVHVVEEPFPVGAEFYPPEVALVRTRLLDDAKRELEEAVAGLDDVDLTAEVLIGPTARRIVECAATHDADLIVMGTRGRGAVATFLMGSVAECVVRTATCPVMTVHDSGRAAAEERERLSTKQTNSQCGRAQRW